MMGEYWRDDTIRRRANGRFVTMPLGSKWHLDTNIVGQTSLLKQMRLLYKDHRTLSLSRLEGKWYRYMTVQS